jgi:hypothetical protein
MHTFSMILVQPIFSILNLGQLLNLIDSGLMQGHYQLLQKHPHGVTSACRKLMIDIVQTKQLILKILSLCNNGREDLQLLQAVQSTQRFPCFA